MGTSALPYSHLEYEFRPLGPLEQANSPLICQIFDLWTRLYEQNKSIPEKSAMNPALFQRCLRYCWIDEYIAEKDDFLCRLTGSEVDNTWKNQHASKMIREIFEENTWKSIHDRLTNVVSRPAIMHVKFHQKPAETPVEKLILPLTDENNHLRFIFGISHYQPRLDPLENVDEHDFIRFYDI